jgi:hypothetical protein
MFWDRYGSRNPGSLTGAQALSHWLDAAPPATGTYVVRRRNGNGGWEYLAGKPLWTTVPQRARRLTKLAAQGILHDYRSELAGASVKEMGVK